MRIHSFEDPLVFVCQYIVRETDWMIKERFPELKQSIPFIDGWKGCTYYRDDYALISLTEDYRCKDGCVETMGSDEISLLEDRLNHIEEYNFSSLYENLGREYYNKNRFLFAGMLADVVKKMPPVQIWEQVVPVLEPWILQILVPILYEAERAKLDKLYQSQLRIDISVVTKNLWVLECEETSKQGTAFLLKGYGLITCEHVLGSDTKAFRPTDFNKKYDIEVLKRNTAIDLAVIKIISVEETNFLDVSNSDDLNQLDPIAVVGFPNYRYGDSGVIHTGHISGFRMVSGIKRILVNTPLIAGNSGSPVFDSQGKVIGVAATGADRMENAHQTEHHSVIPINALDLFN